MRRSTRGILLMDLALSISHDLATGLTRGLLLGCSAKQQEFVIHELRNIGPLACHPLLLPVLITEYHRSLINRLGTDLWARLLSVETTSGQTGAPVMGADDVPRESNDYDTLIKGALNVIQLSAAWETHTQTLLLGAETIQQNISRLNMLSQDYDARYIVDTSAALAERLELTTHRAKVMLSEIQYIYKRGQAQMTAVSYHAHSTSSSLKFCNEKQIYNYIAKNDVKLSHELAAASHKIAAASKRDSTAMKAFALLTMVFLPGTFTAVRPFHPLSSSLNPLEGDSSLKKTTAKDGSY